LTGAKFDTIGELLQLTTSSTQSITLRTFHVTKTRYRALLVLGLSPIGHAAAPVGR
jgi:hypothetical protein